jgi:hypothetical protein
MKEVSGSEQLELKIIGVIASTHSLGHPESLEN